MFITNLLYDFRNYKDRNVFNEGIKNGECMMKMLNKNLKEGK